MVGRALWSVKEGSNTTEEDIVVSVFSFLDDIPVTAITDSYSS